MTSEEAAARVQARLGPGWQRNRPIPPDVLAPLCEALWEEGVSPNRRLIQHLLPEWNEHALGAAVVAWRKSKGLPLQGVRGGRALPTSPVELAKIISAPISQAPHTCFDPANDGRWRIPSVAVLCYLGKIENQSVRDAMALFALLRADRLQYSIKNQIINFAYIMRRVMAEQSIQDVTSIDPNDLLFRIHVGEVGQGLTDHQRRTLLGQWSAVRNVFEEYGEKLSPEQLGTLERFFIRRLTDRRKLARHTTWASYHREQQERVKTKTDALQQHYYRIRYVAGIRCHQVQRFYEAVRQAIAFVQAKAWGCPHEFSYEETVPDATGRSIRQRVELTLWDPFSAREYAITLGYKEAPQTTLQRRWREGRYEATQRTFHVEYRATISLTANRPAEPFWFLDLFRHRVFRLFEKRGDSGLTEKRDAFDKKWGYSPGTKWEHDGILSLGSADYRPLDYLSAQEGREFLPYEGVYAAALFSNLLIRMGTITGARVGEIQQIAQTPECFKQLENVGPKAATRWILRLVPKGRREREPYYIDEDTKDHLVELVRFQCGMYGGQRLPIVKMEREKTPPDRYLLQWNRKGVSVCGLNTLLRFMLHGFVFQTVDGAIVRPTSHLLRHAFATEMADLKVGVDVIAKLLHQRDKTVAKYYSRPTANQVMSAVEMIFVDRIDVGAEALRSPEEIGKMLQDAEGKVGALTEVFGGTCVVANMCPAKFACVGCAGNAPDPAKRYQIEQKLAWAKEQIHYARRENLVAEEQKLRQLVADCGLVMEEMDLIEAFRRDGAQQVHVDHRPKGS